MSLIAILSLYFFYPVFFAQCARFAQIHQIGKLLFLNLCHADYYWLIATNLRMHAWHVHATMCTLWEHSHTGVPVGCQCLIEQTYLWHLALSIWLLVCAGL